MANTMMADRAVLESGQHTQAPAEPGAAVEADASLTEELLVEEVSIDGMCGVY